MRWHSETQNHHSCYNVLNVVHTLAENPNKCGYECALRRHLPFPAGTVMLVIPTHIPGMID